MSTRTGAAMVCHRTHTGRDVSFDRLSDVNWVAVLVAAVAYFAVGGIWFSRPVFGKAWERAVGWEMPEGQQPGPELYVGPLVACLVQAITLALLTVATGTDTVGEGVVLGLVAGIGIAAAAIFVTGVFDPKKPRPMAWFAVTGGYHVVGLVVAAIILAGWR